MSKIWKYFLALLMLTLLAGCGNFKDRISTLTMDSQKADRFENMLVVEQEQLPEDSYVDLGEAQSQSNRPKNISDYSVVEGDALRSLKIKAAEKGGNAITDLQCKELQDKVWQNELSVQCKADVLRINSQEVLSDLSGGAVISRQVKKARAAQKTATRSKTSHQKVGVGWLSRYGVIVTNYHTIKDSENIFVRLPNEKKIQAEVAKQNPGNDIAILSPEQELSKKNGLPLADIRASKGSEVFVLGFSASADLKNNPQIVKAEINSTSGYRGDPRTYLINSSLEKGFSGSPLLTPQGSVLGIVVQARQAKKVLLLPCGKIFLLWLPNNTIYKVRGKT